MRLTFEGKDLDRQCVTRAETVGEFGFVYHDDLALCCLGHDFFVKQGSAAAFDQIELRVHFVGAVDCDVEREGTLGSDERQPGIRGHPRDFRGRGKSPDAIQLSRLVAPRDFPHGVHCGGPGAEADGRPRLDKTHGINGGLFFKFVLRRWHQPIMHGRSFGRETFPVCPARS